jgi:hypothetical protein
MNFLPINYRCLSRPSLACHGELDIVHAERYKGSFTIQLDEVLKKE